VQLANALIAKNVSIIMGPSLTAGCNAITALLKSNGPALVLPHCGCASRKGLVCFTYGVSTAT